MNTPEGEGALPNMGYIDMCDPKEQLVFSFFSLRKGIDFFPVKTICICMTQCKDMFWQLEFTDAILKSSELLPSIQTVKCCDSKDTQDVNSQVTRMQNDSQ